MPVEASAARNEEHWAEALMTLESKGLLDSCAPIVVCVPDGPVRTQILEAFTSDAVVESVLSFTSLNVYRDSDVSKLHALLLGEGDPPCIPARLTSNSWGSPALFLG